MCLRIFVYHYRPNFRKGDLLVSILLKSLQLAEKGPICPLIASGGSKVWEVSATTSHPHPHLKGAPAA